MHLTDIDMSMNSIGAAGCVPLATLLATSKQLRTLDLSYTDTGGLESKHLMTALAWCSNLVNLNLSHNGLGVDGARQLSKTFPWLVNLRCLGLAANGLQQGVRFLGNVLFRLSSLADLDLVTASLKAFCSHPASTHLAVLACLFTRFVAEPQHYWT